MTINLSDNDPRVSYTVGQGVTQTSFAVPFEFFDNDDLNFYVDGTLKTITTHYTVTGGDGSTGTITTTSGNSVVGASGGSTVVITRSIDLDRTTDFPSSGPFNIASLNTELDRLVAITADIQDDVNRSLKLIDFDSAVDTQMPLLAARKGTVLGFNATTGVPEAGPKIADVGTIATISNDIAALADIEDGTIATDAISGLAAVKTNVVNVDNNKTNINAVAGNATNINAVAADATDIGAVAAKATEIGRLGTADAVSDLNTLGTADAVSDMNTLAAISADITAVGDKASIITATLAANLTTVSPQLTTLQSLASIFSGTQTLAVTVVNSGGNKFAIDGVVAPALTLVKGVTYTFDVSDSSVSGHPLAFKDSGGNAFTTGVTTNGTAGSAGATVVIVVPTTGTMPARYYCTSHGNGMGNTIATQTNDIATVAQISSDVTTVASNIGTISQKATVDEATALAIALGG